jgi:hypothetical protein
MRLRVLCLVARAIAADKKNMNAQPLPMLLSRLVRTTDPTPARH